MGLFTSVLARRSVGLARLIKQLLKRIKAPLSKGFGFSFNNATKVKIWKPQL